MTELKLDAGLSFWGGLDPSTGEIIDVHHPQHGESIAGRTLILKRTAGSTSSPGALLEAIRRGRGPAAFVLQAPDMTITSAVFMAKALYGIVIPVTIREARQ